MNKILVTGFGEFLEYNKNSTQEILNKIPNKVSIIKHIFPVGYFKKDFIKIIKQKKPNKIICLGMAPNRKIPQFEIIARNEYITLKNPIYRFIGNIYSYYLKSRNKNLQTSKTFSKKMFTTLSINKKLPKEVKLKTQIPKLKEIKISKNAGNYVCNYSMFIIENYLRQNNLNTKFYFIHIPQEITYEQEKELIEFILN